MKNYSRLLSLVKKYKWLLVFSIVCQIFMAVFTVLSIPLLKPILDLLFQAEAAEIVAKPSESLGFKNFSEHLQYFFAERLRVMKPRIALLWTCGLMVSVYALKNIFRYLGQAFLAPVRNGMVKDLRQKLYDGLVKLPLSYYSDQRKGDLLSRLTNDIQLVENSMIAMITYIFREPFILVGALTYMLLTSIKLTLVVLVLMLVITVLIGGIAKTLKKKSIRAQNELGNLVAVADETISGMRVVKAYNAEPYVRERFFGLNNSYSKLMNRILWRRDLSSPLTEALGIAVVAALIWFGGTQVFDNAMDGSTFMTFLMAFYFVIDPTKNFFNAYANLQKGIGGLDRIEDISDQVDLLAMKGGDLPISEVKEGIRFENVSFRYEEEGPWVLNSIDMEIPVGSCIALVGASGGGKSTLADMIPRFYDPQKGRILIDGRSTSDYKTEDLRALMSVVSQDPVLFHDTILHNITLGGDYSLDQVQMAARAANAHDFISQSPDGYHTIIGDRGVKLSGGQRQRISIARAILKNPPVLILDEATSALDSESEKLVQEALNVVIQNRTTLMIAHRLSTIYKADQIFLIEEGRIIERGTHDELLLLEGKYRQFVEFQDFRTY